MAVGARTPARRSRSSPEARPAGSDRRGRSLVDACRGARLPARAGRGDWGHGVLTDGKRIYMAGAGGMLGEGFRDVLAGRNTLRCSDKDVNADWLTFLDFRDFDAYRREVKAFGPDYLFHLGAYTDLEYCELHADEAYATNTLAVENAVHIANEFDIPLLYISTAGIFDGLKDTYDDWDLPNPLGHYALSKYMGERF